MLKGAIKLYSKELGNQTKGLYFDSQMTKQLGVLTTANTNDARESYKVDLHTSFIPSDNYIKALNVTLKSHVQDCPLIKGIAEYQKEGFLNINDQRVGVWGRVNDPSDILGTCLLDKGKIVKGTFEAMDTHRIYTNQDGLIMLTEFLQAKLLKQL